VCFKNFMKRIFFKGSRIRGAKGSSVVFIMIEFKHFDLFLNP
jgi:hypothetical protein